jgi:hypothetical protein
MKRDTEEAIMSKMEKAEKKESISRRDDGDRV